MQYAPSWIIRFRKCVALCKNSNRLNESIMCNFQSEITKPFFVVLEKPRDWLLERLSDPFLQQVLHDVSSSKAQNEAYHLRYQIRRALQGGLLAYAELGALFFKMVHTGHSLGFWDWRCQNLFILWVGIAEWDFFGGKINHLKSSSLAF